MKQEQIETALKLLFELTWIKSDEHPKEYHLIRRNEKELRQLLSERFDMRMQVHPRFIKLEKIPLVPQTWMGVTEFVSPMDYGLFASAMAFTEEKAEGEPFLLNELVDEISLLYPEPELLDWTNYNHRKSLVRVLTKMTSWSLIEPIDGEIEFFSEQSYSEVEVLYRVGLYSRYFLRSYPKDIAKFASWRQMADSEEAKETRVKVYRRLMMEPVLFHNAETEAEFDYLRRQQSSFESFLEKYTPYSLELTKDMAMLTLQERSRSYTYFPSTKAIDDILLQFADFIRTQKQPKNEFGEQNVSWNQWEGMVSDFASSMSSGWSKNYREMTVPRLAEEIFTVGHQWHFFRKNELGEVMILPSIARMVGRYPVDFNPQKPKEWAQEKATKKPAKSSEKPADKVGNSMNEELSLFEMEEEV